MANGPRQSTRGKTDSLHPRPLVRTGAQPALADPAERVRVGPVTVATGRATGRSRRDQEARLLRRPLQRLAPLRRPRLPRGRRCRGPHARPRRLTQRGSHQFTKASDNRVPGKSALGEFFFVDVGAGPPSWFGLSEKAIGAVAPDMCEYRNPDAEFRSKARGPMTQAVKSAFDSGTRSRSSLTASGRSSVGARSGSCPTTPPTPRNGACLRPRWEGHDALAVGP